jgi:hypothetical protein
MGTGCVLATCLALLAQAQPAPETYFIPDREIRIPLTLPQDPTELANLERFFLYVSTDGGKSWIKEKVVAAKEVEFCYTVPRDGEYWFSVQSETKQKKLTPPTEALVPMLRIVIDTAAPVITRLSAQRVGDQVTASWEVKDDTLDLSLLKLEYRTAEGPTWYGVPLTPPAARSQQTWTVTVPGSVQVRLQAQDKCDHQSVQLADALEKPVLQAGGPAGGGAKEPAARWNPPAAPQDLRPPTDVSPAPGVAAARRPGEAPSISQPWQPAQGPSLGGNPITPASGQVPRGPVAATPTGLPRRGGQPVKYVNKTKFDWNWKLTNIGPSGLGLVQLWATRDNGQTWDKLADAPERMPPFPVELPDEDGVYGLYLVVRSRAGLGRPDPQPGTVPDITVELDRALPEGTLLPVEAGPGRKDVLVLTWKAGKARGQNLGATPISLRWAEKPDGEWKTIAENIPNNGRLVWTMPKDLPIQIYLRLDVRDLAGNVYSECTREPVMVDLTPPEFDPGSISLEGE